jgi:hypothetical protein
MAAYTVMIDRSRAINAFGTYQGASSISKHGISFFFLRNVVDSYVTILYSSPASAPTDVYSD